MPITIERQTGWFNRLGEVDIYCDNNILVSISNNECKEISLPTSPCQIYLKKYFLRLAVGKFKTEIDFLLRENGGFFPKNYYPFNDFIN